MEHSTRSYQRRCSTHWEVPAAEVEQLEKLDLKFERTKAEEWLAWVLPGRLV